MREIKFRGKRLDNGEWVIGSLFNSIWVKSADHSPICNIFPDDMLDPDGDCWEDFASVADDYEVDPATVGQFTGLLDKNGKEIYEGDMLQMWLEDAVEPSGGLWHRMYVVFTTEKGFVLWGERMILEDAEPLHQTLQWKECEIIGTIHDNPELLKAE